MKSNEAYYQDALRDKDWRKRQEDYIKGSQFGGLAGKHFARSMRDLGYKELGNAVNELVDNSLEAEASQICLHMHCTEGKKPAAFMIGDNGHGMIADMVFRACAWGESDRHNSRESFGRFGFGLPSACVHFGDRYTVYSKTSDGDWNRAYVDINLIESGKLTKNGRIAPDGPKKEDPPGWAMSYFDELEGKGVHGTIVIVEELTDTTSKASTVMNRLLEVIGITYRNFLNQVDVFVGGTKACPLDPTFS